MPTASSRSISIGCALFAAGAAALALFGFGPLDPPNGPITPTYKTLSEVEPRIAINAQNTPGDADSVFRISAAGSYYLAGPLSIPSGKNGIEIALGVVTVDLNGFRLQGQAGSRDGIHVNTGLYGITIRNGAIIAARGDGIDAADIVSLMRIERITVNGCTGQGIAVGDSSEIANCTVMNNGSHGINAGEGCRVTDCIANSNGGIGIDVDNDSSVRDCIANGNTTDGISTDDGCAVAGCTASANTANGINTKDACIVSDSIGRANGGIGVDVDNNSIVRDCVAGNNTGNGITANNGSQVTASAAGENDSGIVAGTGATVSECNAYANRTNGIEFGSYSTIWRNTARDNPSAGLATSGDASRIDENHCTGGDLGVVLNGDSCFVSRNLFIPSGFLWSGEADDFVDLYGQSGFDPWDNFTHW